MTGKYFIVAALVGMLGASTATLAASAPAPHPIHHRHAPLQTENAPPASSAAWVLPQGWPHTP